MLAEVAVCPECGNLHLEGGVAPEYITECAECGNDVETVNPADIAGI